MSAGRTLLKWPHVRFDGEYWDLRGREAGIADPLGLMGHALVCWTLGASGRSSKSCYAPICCIKMQV